jgi:hypothetical protein
VYCFARIIIGFYVISTSCDLNLAHKMHNIYLCTENYNNCLRTDLHQHCIQNCNCCFKLNSFQTKLLRRFKAIRCTLWENHMKSTHTHYMVKMRSVLIFLWQFSTVILLQVYSYIRAITFTGKAHSSSSSCGKVVIPKHRTPFPPNGKSFVLISVTGQGHSGPKGLCQ